MNVKELKNLNHGKTKVIYKHPEREGIVVVETNDVLSKGDGAVKKPLDGTGAFRTEQTSNIFEFLAKLGIPVAYDGRGPTPNTFLAWGADMIKYEVVMRAASVPKGSYAKRHPELDSPEGMWFDYITYELFWKDAVVCFPDGHKEIELEDNIDTKYPKDDNGKRYVEASPDIKVEAYTDPIAYIKNDAYADIMLFPQKQPIAEYTHPLATLASPLSKVQYDYFRDRVALPTFRALQLAWEMIPVGENETQQLKLADIKIEGGLVKGHDGKPRLVVADVIDNDSWRLVEGEDLNKDHSKQLFRNGASEEEILAAYRMVTERTRRFADPNLVATVQRELSAEYDPMKSLYLPVRDHSIYSGR